MPIITNSSNIQKQRYLLDTQRIFLSLFLAITIPAMVALMAKNIFQGAEDSPQQYSPILLPEDINLPDSIAGYSILAILNSDTTACIPPHTTRIILQPTVDENPSTYNLDAVLRALEELGRDDILNWGFEFVGPSVTIEQITTENLRWNNQFTDRDCVQFNEPFRPQSSN